jgi:rhodanese-related sulfurtransferase
MKSPTRSVEFFANIAIIAVALILGVVLVKRQFFTNHVEGTNAGADAQIQQGTKLQLSGVDWQENGRTVVLAMAQGCPACAQSAQFYKRLLSEQAMAQSFQVTTLLPQSVSESRQYLAETGLPIKDVRQASLESLGVKIVPTLILADSDGVVIDMWTGKLTADEETEVLERLQTTRDDRSSNQGKAHKSVIEASDLKHLVEGGNKILLLDVRDRAEYGRGHIRGAKNIPLDELEARAAQELPHSKSLVIYCDCTDEELSKAARLTLIDRGFTQLFILRGGIVDYRKAGLPIVTAE